MAWSKLVNDRCHFRQVLHDFTYVGIVCHIGNPSRVESVSSVKKLHADPFYCCLHTLALQYRTASATWTVTGMHFSISWSSRTGDRG